MKYKIEIIILAAILLFSSLLWHKIYAQEITPVGKLSQDYIQRLNNELQQINDIVPSAKQEPVIVNPEAVVKDAVKESIDTISKTIEDVNLEKERVISEIKVRVKEDIDTSIIEIRKQTKKPAAELQKSIDAERIELFENVSKTIDSIKPSNTVSIQERITELKVEIDNSLEKIQNNLQDESGLPVNFERSKREIKDTLLKFQEVIQDKKEVIESRQGIYVFMDSDEDGISDYDEIYIYNTDPYKIRTRGEGRTDGEKIRDGINPLSDEDKPIEYKDPRDDKESFVSSNYKVNKVELIKEENKLVFEGIALPNTYITLYIYSTPIIVTVKTNEDGIWNYSLDKELENGEHQIYVATVDGSGKIVARSNPILFTKSAEAATIGIVGAEVVSSDSPNFLKDNFILITLAILIAVVILGMILVGNHKNIGSAISELKNQVNSK